MLNASITDLENEQADRERGAKRVLVEDFKLNGELISPQNPLPVSTDGASEALEMKVDSNDPNISYIGKAAIGSSTEDAVWQIKKLDETDVVSITWAEANDSYDNVYDNREDLNYS